MNCQPSSLAGIESMKPRSRTTAKEGGSDNVEVRTLPSNLPYACCDRRLRTTARGLQCTRWVRPQQPCSPHPRERQQSDLSAAPGTLGSQYLGQRVYGGRHSPGATAERQHKSG